MTPESDVQHDRILHILYEMALVIGGEVSLKPLLTHTLQRLLYHTSFPAGFVCLDMPPPASGAADGLLEVQLDAVAGDHELAKFTGRTISLPENLLCGPAERSSALVALACCADRYSAFLRLPIGDRGVVVLLAPRLPASELPLTRMFQPVLDSLARAIELCRRNDEYTSGLIAEREQAEKLLQQSQFNLQTLLDLSPMGVLFSREGVMLDANETFLQMFGYANVAEIAGRPVIDCLAPQDHAAFEDRVKRRARGEEVENVYEVTGLRKGGSQFPFLALVKRAILSDGPRTFAFIVDITERKRSEDALRASNELLQSVLENAPIRVFWKDAQLRYLGCNSVFARDAGLGSSAEITGKRDEDLCWKQHADYYSAVDLQVMESGKSKLAFEETQTKSDGERVWLRISKVPLRDAAGKVIGLLGIYDDITKQKQDEEQIRQLAFYDPLTGLPNRRLLLDRIQQAMSAGARSGNYGALMLIDLDQFKIINDTEGHGTGDKLLVETAQRLQDSVREGDSVARLGGDEFVVVLENLSGNPDEASLRAEMVAEKIRDELGRPYWIDGNEHVSTPSIGIAMFRGHLSSQENVFIQADTAMYQAKARGRNAISFFDPVMQLALEVRSEMEKSLRGVLLREELELHYQVQVDCAGQPVGAEVLLRWEHPELGMVSPSRFIPIAEESGLILPIGRWVLETACQQLAAWQGDPLFGQLSVAANVSARQFRQANFVEQVRTMLDDSGIDPGKLKLELTESLVLDNVEDSISKMTQIKALGVRFSMDDFGTGYSSLTYLKRLPLDQIKIDQSFVRDIIADQNDAAIVQTIIAMALTLGLDVIAEGVETERQRDFLQSHDCPAYQGYLFGRPVPVAEFERQLRGRVPEAGLGRKA